MSNLNSTFAPTFIYSANKNFVNLMNKLRGKRLYRSTLKRTILNENQYYQTTSHRCSLMYVVLCQTAFGLEVFKIYTFLNFAKRNKKVEMLKILIVLTFNYV